MNGRLKYFLVAVCLATAMPVCAQQSSQTKPQSADSLVRRETFTRVHNVGPGVTSPSLIPIDIKLDAPQNCATKIHGKVLLSFVVDAHGMARGLGFQSAAGNDLDGIAHKLVDADRFKPARLSGIPVAVSEQDELDLVACSQRTHSSDGKMHTTTSLIAQPVQHISPFKLDPEDLEYALPGPNGEIAGGLRIEKIGQSTGVSTPVVTKNVEAVYSEQAKAKKINAVVIAKFIVDPSGVPRCIRITSPMGYGLDQNAIEAARGYRFKPAMKGGVAVPVPFMVEIVFRMF